MKHRRWLIKASVILVISVEIQLPGSYFSELQINLLPMAKEVYLDRISLTFIRYSRNICILNE